MLRNNSVQLEMFKTDDETLEGQGASGGSLLPLKKIRDYQKSIYIFVAFIFVSLVSYSFGVEKGKSQIAGIMPEMKTESVSLPKAESVLPVGSPHGARLAAKPREAIGRQAQPPAAEAGPVSSKPGPVLLAKQNKAFLGEKGGPAIFTAEKPLPPDKKIEKVNLSAKETGRTNYTIQVASISNSKNVGGELSKLKSKGYAAFSLVKGKYIVICVGKFNAKEDAQINLAKMKTSYPDCQIRRL